MKKAYFILSITIVSIIFLNSCKESKSSQAVNEIESITSSFKDWWSYHADNIDFESDFNAFDYSSTEISKKEFLKKLSSENVIALKTETSENQSTFKLYKLDTINSDEKKSIIKTSNQQASQAYYYYQLQGQVFPEFNFVDLDSLAYSNESVKGKTIILKTWFINCKPCIAEFPKLNEIVSNHKDNKDLLFISLALDSADSLNDFLVKKPFNYAVIPDQKDFITKTLKLNAFPTHVIVDKNGVIQSVGSIKQVYRFLDLDSKEKNTNTLNIPPPAAPSPSM